MDDYLVYPSEQAALDDERIIFQRGARIAANNGYEIDPDGILAKDASGETVDSVTACWDVPRQRADGAWVIRHPQHHDDARNAAWLAYVMRGITAPAERSSPEWWPIVASPRVPDMVFEPYQPSQNDTVQS